MVWESVTDGIGRLDGLLGSCGEASSRQEEILAAAVRSLDALLAGPLVAGGPAAATLAPRAPARAEPEPRPEPQPDPAPKLPLRGVERLRQGPLSHLFAPTDTPPDPGG